MLPDGFAKYTDRDSSFSAAVNKYFKGNDLSPDSTTAYSIRHAFEDRLKDLGVDSEMRIQIVGHALGRSSYGRGFKLSDIAEKMNQMKLKFDPAILE